MDEILQSVRTMLKLLDYKFIYEHKKHYCFRLKTVNIILQSDDVIVRHNRIIIHSKKDFSKLFVDLFPRLNTVINEHDIYDSIVYSGSSEEIAKLVIEFDDILSSEITKDWWDKNVQ